MKKLLTVLLALLLCFSLTACKNDEKESSDTTVKETPITETVETPVEETTTEVKEEVKEVEETIKVEEVKKDNSTLSYWVNFLNKDGSVLQRTTYKYGETPTYNGSTPTYSDYAYYYSFKGWDKKTSPVYGTQTYTALYDVVGTINNNSNDQSDGPSYLTFTAVTAGSSVTPKFKSGTWEFSSDGGNNWTDGSSVGTLTFTKAGDSVMLRGTCCTTNSTYHFSMTGSIAASGDVTSLTNGVGGETDLTDLCYFYMFYNCDSLTTAPNLPATTLAENCYARMFESCTSLTTAPALPATTLAKSCYTSMFSGCTSLTTAPALPATTLAESCYASMFYGCIALTIAPELNATTLATTCYNNMFNGCSSLNVISDSSTTLNNSNSKIYTIVSFSSEDDVANMANMFAGCGGGGIASVESGKTYYCTRYLTFTAVDYTPVSGLKSWSITPSFASGSYQYSTDNGVTWTAGNNDGTTTINLDNVGDKVMLKGTGCVTGDANHFSMNGSIAASGDVTSLTNGVGGDVNLANAYPDYNNGCYYDMFYGCQYLTTAPNLPSTTLAAYCYFRMFYGCTELTIASALPATTLAESCYANMFEGCEKLTKVLTISATTLANYCCNSMFSGCSSLKIAKGKPNLSGLPMGQIFTCPDTSGLSQPVANMFANCYSDFFAFSFTGTPSTNNTYYWYTMN